MTSNNEIDRSDDDIFDFGGDDIDGDETQEVRRVASDEEQNFSVEASENESSSEYKEESDDLNEYVGPHDQDEVPKNPTLYAADTRSLMGISRNCEEDSGKEDKDRNGKEEEEEDEDEEEDQEEDQEEIVEVYDNHIDDKDNDDPEPSENSLEYEIPRWDSIKPWCYHTPLLPRVFAPPISKLASHEYVHKPKPQRSTGTGVYRVVHVRPDPSELFDRLSELEVPIWKRCLYCSKSFTGPYGAATHGQHMKSKHPDKPNYNWKTSTKHQLHDDNSMVEEGNSE